MAVSRSCLTGQALTHSKTYWSKVEKFSAMSSIWRSGEPATPRGVYTYPISLKIEKLTSINVICMPKLLDADWLRSVKLFINCTAVQLMILPKQTKWRKAKWRKAT